MAESVVDADIKIDAQYWMRAGEAAIRAYCGWHVCPVVTETLTLDTSRQRFVKLPSMRVLDVGKVEYLGRDVTGSMSWSEAGLLKWKNKFLTFDDEYRGLKITLTHGYELGEVPQIVSLIATVGRRAADQKTVASQSVNGASVAYLTAGGAPLSVPLLSIEKEMLAPYRLSGGIAVC